jgi:aminoglycoside/choline kinase family phosphotransferase
LPVFSRQFDERKYSEEFQFTFHHLVEGFLKLPALSPRVLASVQSFCADLETFRPLVFCHRDYHTRNLLVHEGQLRLIDFQDARLGPVEYDLASLFFDAYVPIASDDRNRLLSLYRKRLENFPLGAQIDWKQLPDRLHHLAFQRTIKAAGSFASFFTRYGKNTHLPYLVPALESARSLQKILGAAAPALPLDRWIEKARGVVR